MHLGHKNHGYSYYMDTKQLDIVEEEKDLGIVITIDVKNVLEKNKKNAKKRKKVDKIKSV